MSIYNFLQLSNGYDKLDNEIKKIEATIMNIDSAYKQKDIFKIPFEFTIRNVVRKNFDVYDLQLLLNKKGRYLNSSIIQAYATLIAKTNPKYQILQIEEGKCTETQFSTGGGDTDFIVVYNIPSSHWVLAHVKRSDTEKAMIYDSNPASTNLETMKKCLKMFPLETMKTQVAPQQQSGKNECGLYVMLSMNAITLAATKMNFSPLSQFGFI